MCYLFPPVKRNGCEDEFGSQWECSLATPTSPFPCELKLANLFSFLCNHVVHLKV